MPLYRPYAGFRLPLQSRSVVTEVWDDDELDEEVVCDCDEDCDEDCLCDCHSMAEGWDECCARGCSSCSETGDDGESDGKAPCCCCAATADGEDHDDDVLVPMSMVKAFAAAFAEGWATAVHEREAAGKRKKGKKNKKK